VNLAAAVRALKPGVVARAAGCAPRPGED